MTRTKIICLVAASLFYCVTARSQTAFSDDRTRLLLNTEIGSEADLGYQFPSFTVGPSFEIPVASRFEIQTGGSYSPDHKNVTKDGQLADVNASVVGFATPRLGFIAGFERGWLWTSQFDKKAMLPSAGIVLRNDYLGHGRFYLTYVFPTGCAWATPDNPCRIESNRLQGITLRQETRSFSHMRWGVESGLYHFCDQANPNEPQTGRRCQYGVSALLTLSIESHLGHRSRIASANAVDSDDF